MVYKDYPEFAKAGIDRPLLYNQQIAEINRLAREGRIFNIAPSKPIMIKRIEGNIKKIRALYEPGRKVGEKIVPNLDDYLTN